MKVSVIKYTGEETGRTVALPEEVFGIVPNDHVVYLDVKSILANQRQGTHKAKERGEVSGSRRKIKKQKGTGGARAGDAQSPVFRGGGRIFGPKPRKYGFKLNQKVKLLARRSVCTYKARENNVLVLESFSFEAPKTKHYLNLLKNLSFQDEKTLLIVPSLDHNLLLSSRNIPKAKVLAVEYINTYDLLHTTKLLIVEDAIPQIVQKLT